MSNCNLNKVIINKLAKKKIDDKMEIHFTVMEDIDSCAKINTRKYLTHDAQTVPVYYKTKIPQDLINICESFGCKNTGTLQFGLKEVAGEGDTKNGQASVDFQTISDATEYVAGVLYYYIYVDAEGTYTVKSTVSDIVDANATNSDTYVSEIKANGAGFYPVTVELSKVPEETTGEGWEATTSGTHLKIDITKIGGTGVVGVSSISFFDDVEDLNGNNDIVVGCVDEVGGDIGIDPLEASCFGGGYDEDSINIEKTITYKAYTPNIDKLNPLVTRGDKTEGFYMKNVEYVVKKYGDTDYGYIHLSDSYDDECGFIYASMTDNCNITDGSFARLNNPNLVTLDEKHFQVINQKNNPSVDWIGSMLFFNENMIGEKLQISYPKTADAEHFVANTSALNGKRVKATIPYRYNDGTMYTYIYHNVLITSFPNGLTKEEDSGEMTLSIQKQRDGNYFEYFRINEAEAQL